MSHYFTYAAYGWLTLSGIMHMCIDVLYPYATGKRAPSTETTLYYGLHSAFALGQIVFGLTALFLAWKTMHLLNGTAMLTLSIAAAAAWLAITFVFMEYWEPRFAVSLFIALLLAAWATR